MNRGTLSALVAAGCLALGGIATAQQAPPNPPDQGPGHPAHHHGPADAPDDNGPGGPHHMMGPMHGRGMEQGGMRGHDRDRDDDECGCGMDGIRGRMMHWGMMHGMMGHGMGMMSGMMGRGMGMMHGGMMMKGPWIGVAVGPTDPALSTQLRLPEHVGLVVEHVMPDSPATKAGLKEYDVLQKLDDQLLVNPEQLLTLVHMHKAGDTVTLTVIRAGQPTEVKVSLAEHQPRMHPMGGPGHHHGPATRPSGDGGESTGNQNGGPGGAK